MSWMSALKIAGDVMQVVGDHVIASSFGGGGQAWHAPPPPPTYTPPPAAPPRVSRREAFGAYAAELADRVGLVFAGLEPDALIATFRCKPGKGADGYEVLMALPDTGQVVLHAVSHTSWDGEAPRRAHALMERFDRKSRRVSFKVTRSRSGSSRCNATAVFADADDMPPSVFSDVAGEMLAGLITADEELG